jgi:CheY-like chemotaxis protein
MREKHGLDVHFRGDERASGGREEVRVHIFESVRELLFNVVKHAQTDRADVEMTVVDLCQLRITVRDYGRGFDVKAAMEASGDRGGFGLFSIRERLTLLGGTFDVRSQPGEGARFTLLAPLEPLGSGAAERSAPSPRLRPAASLAPGRRGDPGSIRVLLVEDHDVVREGLKLLVTSAPGMEVVGEASDGVEGLAQAHALHPDVVLMDFSMPRMDGANATRRICEELPGVQVIGLSMYDEPERAAAMMEAGAAAYLTKSGESLDLVERIRTVHNSAHSSGV